MIKKHVNKELGLTKEGNKDIKNSTKCWICDTDCTDDDVKVRDRCHITRKYKSSAHRNCNINVKLNRKISVIFHDLQKLWFPSYYVRTINLKTNVIPSGLEKYMSFSINNKLIFIDEFQFLVSSSDSLCQSLGKDNFKC